MPMMTLSGREIPEQDRAALTIEWGGKDLVLPVNRNPCAGESLWSIRIVYGVSLDVVREHVGRSTPWRASVMSSLAGAYGHGMTMECAVIDCREKLAKEMERLYSQASLVARALGVEES